MKRTVLEAAVLLGLILSACGAKPQATPTAAPTITPPPTATETEIPPTLTATPTPTEIPTATPFIPFEVVIASTDAANLRAGPGFLFLILKVLNPGTKTLLLGRAPGSEWFYVQVNDSLKGWVFGQLLRQDEDLLQAPLLEPTDVGVIHGRVLDTGGSPIHGIGFSVIRRSAPAEPGDAVTTDSNGEFYSFLPYKGGVWTVTFNAIACDSNVWKDTECTYYKEGYQGIVEPPAQDVRLPQTDIPEFTWK